MRAAPASPHRARLPRRVLMTADAVGGVWTYALELASGLSQRRIETCLAVLGPAPSDAQRAAAAAIDWLELVVVDAELEWRDRLGLNAPKAAAALRMLVNRYDPDVVHLNSYREAAYGLERPTMVVAHSCVSSWWWACRGGKPPAEWQAYVDGVRAGLHAADAVVAPTAAFLAELTALYGPLPNARVIHNGRQPALSLPHQREPIILAAGRLWDEAKNIAQLVRVEEQLHWPVHLAGDGAPANAMPNVQVLGPLPHDELLRHMAGAEIFCAPARYEPFGLAILEAATMHAALVLGDVPSLRELWHEAALFVPPDDDAALITALNKLAADDQRRRALQVAAVTRARRYSRDAMIDACLALYAELLASADGAREVAA